MRALSTLLLFAMCGAGARGGCLPLRNQQITAADIAAAVPAFGPAGERAAAPAPLAGSERVFLHAELVRLAHRFGLDSGTSAAWPASVCFAFPLRPLEESRIREALARLDPTLGPVEILDLSRFPVADGPLNFPAGALAARDQTGGARTLRGTIHYAPGREQPVWVRLRFQARRQHNLAARVPLAAGAPVAAGDVEPVAATAAAAARGIEEFRQLDGLVPRRAIPAGTLLHPGMFRKPREVAAGQTIEVVVRSGNARLAFQTRAETGGDSGEQVLIRSPLSDQRLKVRVAGSGRALLDLTNHPTAEEQP